MGYDDGRMIRKSISDSKKVAKLSPEALSLFCFLIPHFSSHGKMNGSPHYIKGEVCPRIEWLDVPTIIKCLREIHKHTSVKWFEHDGRLYLHSTNNDEHQNLQDYKKGTDRMPDYGGENNSGATPDLLQSNSRVTPDLLQHKDKVKDKDKIKEKGVKSAENADSTPLTRDLTDFTIQKILNNHTALKFTSADKKKFDDVFDKLIRLDNRPPEQIREVITWVTSQTEKKKGDFCWADQFQSPLKLRKKDSDGVKYYDKWLSMMLSRQKEEKPRDPIHSIKIISPEGKESYAMWTLEEIQKKVPEDELVFDGDFYLWDRRPRAGPSGNPAEIREKIHKSLKAGAVN